MDFMKLSEQPGKMYSSTGFEDDRWTETEG